MAKATKNVETITMDKGVVLELDPTEAEAIFALVAHTLVTGKWGEATYRIYQELDELGYSAFEGGFPGERAYAAFSRAAHSNNIEFKS